MKPISRILKAPTGIVPYIEGYRADIESGDSNVVEIRDGVTSKSLFG